MLKYKKNIKDELIHSVIYPAWIIYAPVFEAAQVVSFCFAEKKQYSIFQKMEESKKMSFYFNHGLILTDSDIGYFIKIQIY